MLVIQLLLLLLTANGAPILARQLLTTLGGCPIDAGLTAWDGRPLLGPSKTVRGLIAATVASAVVALLFGLPLQLGILIGVGAMLGDALSSFTKRRLGIAPSGRAPGLDQIPESLIPLLLVADPLQLSAVDITIVVCGFILLEILLSRILYRLKIRKRPY